MENRKNKAAKKKKETHSLHTLRTQFLEIPPGHGPWQHLAEPYIGVNILSFNLRHTIWSKYKTATGVTFAPFYFLVLYIQALKRKTRKETPN